MEPAVCDNWQKWHHLEIKKSAADRGSRVAWMASRLGQRSVAQYQEYSDSNPLTNPSDNPLNELFHSASWWADREQRGEQEDSLREQLKETDEHVARLQDMLKYERTKCSRLQLRCAHQEAALKRLEQQYTTIKERLPQLTELRREKPSMDVLNPLPGGRARRAQRPDGAFRHEEATLRLMLERREAELREETTLRHNLAALLRALGADMEQAANDNVTLAQVEGLLDDQATAGVIQSWRRVQKRLGEVLLEGVGTDQDKLLAQLEAELKESRQLVQLQQQLLQDSLASPVGGELADSYFLEEWERLQMQFVELDHQRRTFERERQSFTDAAIRLSHERRDFEQQKAFLMKQQYLCDSPLYGKGLLSSNRRESTALNFSGLGPTGVSGCLPITPSSTESGVRIQTPTTPELYSALNLSYNCRCSTSSLNGSNNDVVSSQQQSGARACDDQLQTWDGAAARTVHTPQAPHLDWSS